MSLEPREMCFLLSDYLTALANGWNGYAPGPWLAAMSMFFFVAFSHSFKPPISTMWSGLLYITSLPAIAMQDRGKTTVKRLACVFTVAFLSFALYAVLAKPGNEECLLMSLQAVFLLWSLWTSWMRAVRLLAIQKVQVQKGMEEGTAEEGPVCLIILDN